MVWIKAGRLKLHILGMLPVFIGVLIAFDEQGRFRWLNLVFAEIITLGALMATAFANDYADVEGDRLNKQYNQFSGGSRVIVEGAVSRQAMAWAATIASVISLVLSLLFILFFHGRPLVLALNLIGLALGIEYSLPPLKINYRGFGEAAVVLAYSIFCLFFGYVCAGGPGFNSRIAYLSLPIALAIFLIILITEVPDCESDQSSGKKTIPVILGLPIAMIIYVIGLGLLYTSTGVLYYLRLINSFIFRGLYLSMPLAIYLGWLATLNGETGTARLTRLCAGTLVLNVWVGGVICLKFISG